MKPKDIFGLAVRILGLVFFYHLLLAVPTIIGFSGGCGWLQLGVVAIGIALALAVIWWLIGGAPLLTNRAYPDEGSATTNHGEKADA